MQYIPSDSSAAKSSITSVKYKSLLQAFQLIIKVIQIFITATIWRNILKLYCRKKVGLLYGKAICRQHIYGYLTQLYNLLFMAF